MTPLDSASPLLQVEALSDPFEAALAYRRAGLCIIPLNGKHPALPEWKKFQSHRSGEVNFDEWRQQGMLSNLGIVCGKVSHNPAVLDLMVQAAIRPLPPPFPSWSRHSLF